MSGNLGISSILKQNNANVQAFIDDSLGDLLPKFRQHAKYLQDFYLPFCSLLKIMHKISKIVQRRMGQYKKCVYLKDSLIIG